MSESTTNEAAPAPRRKIRWIPLALIVLFGAATMTGIQLRLGADSANRFLATVAWTLLMSLLATLWLVFGAGLRRRARVWVALAALGAAVVLFGVVPALFRVKTVTGDLRPTLTWRWAPKADLTLERSAGAAAATIDSEAVVHLTADDPAPHNFPQFLGPARDGVVTGVRLARDWEQHPPRRVWRRAIGAGWSSFSVVDNLAVTQEQRGDEEMVVCYDLKSGEPIWMHADPLRFSSVLGGDGPRSSPTIDRGRVYTLGATGLLNALDLLTGEPAWPTRDTLAEHNARNTNWGRSGSPLVVDDLVVVSAGGRDDASLVAYRRQSGEPAWSAGDGFSSYASPIVATVAGVRQILIINAGGLASHDPEDGRLLWEYSWPGSQPKVTQPVLLSDDRIFIAAGYGLGCVMLRLTADEQGELTPEELWNNRNLKPKFSNVVVRGDVAFGLDERVLVCLDLETGERRWRGARFGFGQLLLIDDVLLVAAEDGELALVDAAPDAYRELGRFQAIDGKTWNCPTFAAPYLLLRNAEEAACYELTLAEP